MFLSRKKACLAHAKQYEKRRSGLFVFDFFLAYVPSKLTFVNNLLFSPILPLVYYSKTAKKKQVNNAVFLLFFKGIFTQKNYAVFLRA
jgi:hypothetical protein